MLAKGMYYAARLALWRIPVLGGVTPLAIAREKPNGGDERVERVRVLDAGGHERHFECEAVDLGFGVRKETQIAARERWSLALRVAESRVGTVGAGCSNQ